MGENLIINFKKYLFVFVLSIILFQNIKADEIYDEGKKIFLEKANCAVCHKLADAESQGDIGPNLNDIKPDMMTVLNVVKQGIGVMPSFEGQLSDSEIKAVAKYVSESASK